MIFKYQGWIHSGRSRNSPRRGRQLPGGGANIQFCHIFPKTAWNWKNLGPGGRIPRTPFRSATDQGLSVGGEHQTHKFARFSLKLRKITDTVIVTLQINRPFYDKKWRTWVLTFPVSVGRNPVKVVPRKLNILVRIRGMRRDRPHLDPLLITSGELTISAILKTLTSI